MWGRRGGGSTVAVRLPLKFRRYVSRDVRAVLPGKLQLSSFPCELVPRSVVLVLALQNGLAYITACSVSTETQNRITCITSTLFCSITPTDCPGRKSPKRYIFSVMLLSWGPGIGLEAPCDHFGLRS